MGAQELPGGPGFIVLCARELLFLPISISQESKMNYVGSEMSANDASLYPVHLPSSCQPSLAQNRRHTQSCRPAQKDNSGRLPDAASWFLGTTGSYLGSLSNPRLRTGITFSQSLESIGKQNLIRLGQPALACCHSNQKPTTHFAALGMDTGTFEYLFPLSKLVKRHQASNIDGPS